MERHIILCDNNILWETELKEAFKDEDIITSHTDSIEDIWDSRLFPVPDPDIIICCVEEFYNIIESMDTCNLDRYTIKNGVSIFIIADRYSVTDELAALKAGCYDYQTRDTPIEIIAQRIRNRLSETDCTKKVYFDKNSKEIYANGNLVKLTGREKEVLALMLNNKNTPVNKEVILKEVWGSNFKGDIRVIDTIIKQLRKKLAGCNINITTHYGKGYSVSYKK